MQVVSSGDNLRELSYSILVEKIIKFTTNLMSVKFLHSKHSIKLNVLSIPKREREKKRKTLILPSNDRLHLEASIKYRAFFSG